MFETKMYMTLEQIHSLYHVHDNQSHPQMESTNLCFLTALQTLFGIEDHQKASREILEYQLQNGPGNRVEGLNCRGPSSYRLHHRLPPISFHPFP
jgi:hypothetical protein